MLVKGKIDYANKNIFDFYCSPCCYQLQPAQHCGLNLADDGESGYQVSELDQSSLDQYTYDFFNKHEDQLKTFRRVTKLIKKGERYIGFVNVNSNSGVNLKC